MSPQMPMIRNSDDAWAAPVIVVSTTAMPSTGKRGFA
jgi:hypothetical protein